MPDLFSFNKKPIPSSNASEYNASDIEVLEGLEPVRKRPGMYIGGTDEDAMHHLISEVLDNAMDEAVAGYANVISIKFHADYSVTISDNGRGIPVDNHPKFPNKSALEVILTTLHSGGKFSNRAYKTAGGLHGVGISVVNALSDKLKVLVYREGKLFTQKYERGIAVTELYSENVVKKLRGTSINFHPDAEIFGEKTHFKPHKIYELAKAKAYLYRGVTIEWEVEDDSLLNYNISLQIPTKCTLHFPNGVEDYIKSKISADNLLVEKLFCGNIESKQDNIKMEWAVAWNDNKKFIQSYCNTISTPLGGTHEQGLRAALLKSFRTYGEMTGNKKISHITIEDILENSCIVLSVFITDPVFQGQTKEKLVSNGISRIIENIIKDHFDHWLSSNKTDADLLLSNIIEAAELRISRRSEKNIARKNLTIRLRLPGKLADCSSSNRIDTELFLVEGDSAGGSAKQARNRETQAVLPLKGKILNIANSNTDKISQNQEIQDLEIALACGTLKDFQEEKLRYDKIIIMTDADVDGAHIASLLMTFFYLRMPKLIETGHLYIARPPLYRLTQGNKTYYAANDTQKGRLVEQLTKESRAKIEIGRFKGLGEMTPAQLKETTMDIKNRSLFKVTIDDFASTSKIVDDLMGKKAERRFEFIHSQALSKMNNIINNLDI